MYYAKFLKQTDVFFDVLYLKHFYVTGTLKSNIKYIWVVELKKKKDTVLSDMLHTLFSHQSVNQIKQLQKT